MTTNNDFNQRRAKAVARAIAYTSTFTAERAENAEIWDVEGKRYIDFCGGIGCQNIGHRHPKVVAAIENQLSQLTHTCVQIVPYESYISLAERIKELMEIEPFYALLGSPINESPLGLFSSQFQRQALEDKYGIPSRFVPRVMSPWAAKRLAEYEGDITKFKVVKLYPSILNQLAIAKTEPGDEHNQDISSLVGKVDIRKLEEFSQDDPDAYSFSGGLCRGHQGMLEFVEMFKAPIKTLNPLLTATQEGNYKGTEGLGAIPFTGIILPHSNESEWQEFHSNKRNEAFIDRVNIVKVPYCLRITEEEEIYKKLIRHSSLADAACAPQTLRMMAQFSVLTRIKDPGENSNLFSKMRAYDGE
ncbi:MAG: aminotransferase class III-fold pyridoxal phosphate-dependent enzyme, partial [Proteobacteria bacterium]|nr:aminotransferase class III-fold pyridoxal phosphate-dependent enzyme [Pseudomonadota bacterium]